MENFKIFLIKCYIYIKSLFSFKKTYEVRVVHIKENNKDYYYLVLMTSFISLVITSHINIKAIDKEDRVISNSYYTIKRFNTVNSAIEFKERYLNNVNNILLYLSKNTNFELVTEALRIKEISE